MPLSREKVRQLAKRAFKRRHVKRARREGEKETYVELADLENRPEPEPSRDYREPSNNLS